MLFKVDDLIVYTEEYQEEYLEKYIEENESYFN